jgi:ABC-type polysaccharide/polyol phosphate export permease
MKARIACGFLWGVVATVAMTLVHLGIWAVEGRLTVHAMATQMMPAMIISKMFETGLPIGAHEVTQN